MLQPFRQLFQGGELGYGQWHTERGAVTRKGAAPLAAYEQHLAGDIGLGLVPVRLDGTCLFGAIDIDVDDIDHVALAATVSSLGLPLNVCRSKSGGAHLYAFLQQPLDAVKLQLVLKRWAVALGHGKAEIFPKQVKIEADNIGNWINLPYFGGDLTTRYAVTTRALSLQEFLDGVRVYDGKSGGQTSRPMTRPAGVIRPPDPPEARHASAPAPALRPDPVNVDFKFDDGPPCLQQLAAGGVKSGGRNSVFFNVGVYLRKAVGDNYKNQLEHANKVLGQPPLEQNELKVIARSLAKASYHYTCNQEPLLSCCDKTTCLKRPFGVGYTAPVEDGGYAAFEPSNLRKVLTNPPHYYLQVNNRDVKLEFLHLASFAHLRNQITAQLDIVVPTMKQSNWEQVLHTLLSLRVDVPAPLDASSDGLILEKVFDFLETRELATSVEDLLRGLPIQSNGEVLFRAGDLRKFLQMYKIQTTIDQVFAIVQHQGCKIRKVQVAGKHVEAWAFPVEKLNEQTENFTVQQFNFKDEL